jgi:two-component system response regulator AtoC
MVFALGGQAALAEIERASFDVIVSDMRMPGMDGRALLQQVKKPPPRRADCLSVTRSRRTSSEHCLSRTSS